MTNLDKYKSRIEALYRNIVLIKPTKETVHFMCTLGGLIGDFWMADNFYDSHIKNNVRVTLDILREEGFSKLEKEVSEYLSNNKGKL